MTIQEARREYDDAATKLRDAIDEQERIQDSLRIQEAKRTAGLREAAKVELEAATRVFESLGMPKEAAMAAAQGRAA
jgi:hypothetical protein